MNKLTKKDIKNINRLRGLFPDSIAVHIDRSEDGGFCAKILTFSGCFTESNTFSELIEMANDAVRVYLDVPEKYLPFMPNYIPPMAVAKKLNLFPVKEKSSEIKLIIPNAEKISC